VDAPSGRNKNNEPTEIPLNNEALAVLRRMKRTSTDPHLFGEMKGVFRFWRAVLKQAGLKDFRVHDFRHVYARKVLNSGSDHKMVAKLLGQRDSSMAKRYAKYDLETMRAASNRGAAAIKAKPAQVIPLVGEKRQWRSA